MNSPVLSQRKFRQLLAEQERKTATRCSTCNRPESEAPCRTGSALCAEAERRCAPASC
jgi:glutamate synthase (NADPH) large chain